jgi:hypothetical protein
MVEEVHLLLDQLVLLELLIQVAVVVEHMMLEVHLEVVQA